MKLFSDFTYDLAEWLKKEQKVFFLLGAACSYNNGIPLMNNFVSEIAVELPG